MIDILESKVVGTNKETWYKLIGTKDDTKPTGEFPAGTGHTVAKDSTFFEIGTQIRYEFDGTAWAPKGQVPTELQDKTVTPTTEQQTIQADDGYDGLDTVTVEAVTAAIDENIQSSNIRQGKTILGIPGNLNPENNANYPIIENLGKYDIESVEIPNGVTSLQTQQAFGSMTRLKFAKIPSSLQTIAEKAFYGCTALETVIIESGVKRIESQAFASTALSSIELPSTITYIATDAFRWCPNLTNITVHQNQATSPIASKAPWGATNATVTWTG